MITRLIIAVIVSSFCQIVAADARTWSHGEKNTVVDSIGRRVILPEVNERIACLYAFTGHVVAMLGRANNIVAVSNGLKRDVLLSTMYPEIRKAVVPKYQGAINIEELARAKPDIVFVAAETGRNHAETAKLNACGLTWVAVGFHSMEQQQEAVTLIGKAIGELEKALSYSTYYRNCVDMVNLEVEAIPLKNRVRVYNATNEPTRTSPKNSLPTDWIRTAGIINVAAQEPTRLLDGKYRVGIEQILLWDPDFILANEPGVVKFIRKSPKWSAMSAVQNGRVYQLPIGVSRWGHPGSLETPLALLWTAKTVYPERFSHLDMQKELSYFYKKFFNYELSDQMIERILRGQGMRLTKNRKRKQ